MGSLVFDKINLTGFKSFVEPTDFIIEPGLTGVVGPNGCGKSNLLEAIRWVMGANSAKAMRGSQMEDVIFSGTRQRQGRNQAHVTLHIDNSARVAPAAFNDSEQLEVMRVITKGKGSTYKINGKTVRAKDVQLLFADASTSLPTAAACWKKPLEFPAFILAVTKPNFGFAPLKTISTVWKILSPRLKASC
jgi:chromosome segregation protein